MPSTVVHVAFAGMIAAALLGTAFDRRALAVVFGAVIVADLDAFVALVWAPAHRTAFHTLVLPLLAGVLIAIDLHRGHESFLRRRWGARGVRLAWVTVLIYAVAAIGLDLFTGGGVNPLWPVHDQFYQIDGKIELSSTEGVVQTFVDPSGTGESETVARGSTETVHISTGVDPVRGAEPANVERVFPVVRSGWQLLVLVAGTLVTGARAVFDHEVDA